MTLRSTQVQFHNPDDIVAKILSGVRVQGNLSRPNLYNVKNPKQAEHDPRETDSYASELKFPSQGYQLFSSKQGRPDRLVRCWNFDYG